MTNPSELVLQDRGFNAGNLCLLQVDVEDGAQASLVEALKETDVAAIGDPGLRAVEKGGENNSPIDADLCFAF